MRLFAFIVLSSVAGAAQTLILNFDREEIIPPSRGAFVPPVWSGPFLVGTDLNTSSSPIIWTLDRSGAKEEIQFPVSDAALVSIRGIAASEDGTLVVTGGAMDQHAVRFSFIATIPKDRSSPGIVRDERFSPRLITVTPDGVVWVMGSQTQKDNPVGFANVLKRFSPTGKLLTSTALNFGLRCDIMKCTLRTAKDRVGFFDEEDGYVEFSLDATVINRFPPPKWGAKYPNPTCALSDNLTVVIQGRTGRMLVLDRMKRVWNPLEVEESNPILLGFDGPQLVLQHSTKDRGIVLAHYLLSDDPH
jgi:hypothetical protein